MTQPTARRTLGQRLKQARKSALLRSVDLARDLGISQGQLSRIENGQRRASEDLVRSWLERAGEATAVIDDLVSQVELADREITDWKKRFSGGWAADQRRYEDLESDASAIGAYQVSVVPGLLQTPAYTDFLLRHVVQLDDKDVATGVAARSRRQRLFYESGTEFSAVVAEQVLRHRGFGGPAVMVEQLHRIAKLAADVPAMDLAIIPIDTDMPLPYMVSFDLYELADDDALVLIEFDTGEIRESEPHRIQHYRQRLDDLRSAARSGDEALRLLERITTDLASVPFH